MRARAMGVVVTVALAVVVLSACPPPEVESPESPEDRSPDQNRPQNGTTQLPTVRGPDAALVASAARNAPRAGSVTQGSRGAGTTADRVSWTGNGVQVEGMTLTEDVTESIDLASGLKYYTDSGRNGAVAAVATGIARSSGQALFDASDPVVFGPWMYRTGSGFVWGMFADSLRAIESTGIPGAYDGTTIGVYTDAEGVVEFFIARVDAGGGRGRHGQRED